MARSLSWTTSARTLPPERSIHSVILSTKASATELLSVDASRSIPIARAATARVTVCGSTPVNWAAAR